MDVDETSWSDRINRDQKNFYDQTYAVKKKRKFSKSKRER